MKNILNQYLNKEEISEPKTKKVKKVKRNDDIVEVVEKTLVTEDGRQILIG